MSSKWIAYDYGWAEKPKYKPKGGCYVVFLDGKLVYIGQSLNVKKRIAQHKLKPNNLSIIYSKMLDKGINPELSMFNCRIAGAMIDPTDRPHFNTPWGIGFRSLIVKVGYSKKFGEWAMTEMRLIKRLDPLYNKMKMWGA